MLSKRKKICFISFQAYSLFNQNCKVPHGGSEVQLYNLATYLAQSDESEVFFLVGDFGQQKKEVFKNVCVLKTVPLKRRKNMYLTKFYYLLRIFLMIKNVNADVYIQRAAGVETGLFAFFCKILRKKFIYMTASDIDVDGRYRKNNRLSGFLYEYGIKTADVVVAQNEKHKEILKEKYNIYAEVIKNSFIFPKEIPGLSNKKYILWVGTSQLLKQPEMFLAMAKSMLDEKFVMIMPKHDLDLWNKIEKEARNIPNITFIERVPFEKIDKYFAEASLFVNTSTFEGFPNTFVQSVMQATPIASLNVDPDNFLEKHSCGFCAGGDIKNLVNLSAELFRDKENWREACLNARQYGKDNHDIETNIKKILKILN